MTSASEIGSECPEVEVERGEVVLRGQVDTGLEAELLEKRVRLVVGVVGVLAELTWAVDRSGRSQAG
jgi:osmotically-inducible protein OsmY